MKKLTERTDIAQALNFGKYPVLGIDISECDEYGLKGSKCRIDFGEFDDGSKFYERAELRVYGDEMKLTFSAGGCGLSKDFSYYDFEEDMVYAAAPIVKANSEIAVSVFDSQKRELYGVFIVETGNVNKFCSTPLTCKDADMSTYVIMAKARYGRDKYSGK